MAVLTPAVVLQGNTRRLRATFLDLDGHVFDGSTVKFTVLNGRGQRRIYTYNVNLEVVREGVGIYYIDIVLNVPGTWRYYWNSEGNIAAAGENFISVKAAP